MSNKDSYPVTPLDDDVSSFPADEARLNSYRDASAQLADFEVPRFVVNDVSYPILRSRF